MVKRCLYCGRWFRPDSRVGKRQKACRRDACRKARRQHSQSAWSEKNLGYFRGRYPYVKQWRSGKPAPPMIQDEITPKKPVTRMIFLIPGGLRPGVIQDEIMLKRLTGHTYLATGAGQ
jgi:hypothetical protein